MASQYEYLIVRFGADEDFEKRQNRLNSYGAEGWELVSDSFETYAHTHEYTFKRQVSRGFQDAI